MINEFSRRRFLTKSGGALTGAWVAAHWPQMLAAATHAHAAAQSATPHKFAFFTPEEAVEVEAISERIIPSDETPGAKEAGVIYFIDAALLTFAVDDQTKYHEGLPDLQKLVQEKFSSVQKFSAATAEQQDEILQILDESESKIPSRRRNVHSAKTFFEAVRIHTIAGFLIDPESGTGNRGGVGWKLIHRDTAHGFQPPFGFYDKDYAGWHPSPKAPANAGLTPISPALNTGEKS